MALSTITIDGVEFDVYHTLEVEKDPYGTGDSPTSITVDIHEIEPAGCAVDLLPFLSSWVYDYCVDEIIKEFQE